MSWRAIIILLGLIAMLVVIIDVVVMLQSLRILAAQGFFSELATEGH